MGCVVTIESPYKSIFKKINHYLFHCPTFWSIKPKYHCSKCGAGYRCYWDANDIEDYGINICNRCAKKIEEARLEAEEAAKTAPNSARHESRAENNMQS
jgi:DNA-directed RNA polymerase subunit RPC12/RpoP